MTCIGQVCVCQRLSTDSLPLPPHPELTHVRPDGCIPAPPETGVARGRLTTGSGQARPAGYSWLPDGATARKRSAVATNAPMRRPRLPWWPAMDTVSMSRDRIGRPYTATKPGGEGIHPKRAQQTAPERSALRRWQCGVALLLQSFPVPNWSRAATVSSAAGRRRHRWRPRRRRRRASGESPRRGRRRLPSAANGRVGQHQRCGPSQLPRHCKRQTSHTGPVSGAWTSHRAIEHRAFTINGRIPLGADSPPPPPPTVCSWVKTTFILYLVFIASFYMLFAAFYYVASFYILRESNPSAAVVI